MDDVESAIVEFYTRVITILLDAVEQTEQFSRCMLYLGLQHKQA